MIIPRLAAEKLNKKPSEIQLFQIETIPYRLEAGVFQQFFVFRRHFSTFSALRRRFIIETLVGGGQVASKHNFQLLGGDNFFLAHGAQRKRKSLFMFSHFRGRICNHYRCCSFPYLGTIKLHPCGALPPNVIVFVCIKQIALLSYCRKSNQLLETTEFVLSGRFCSSI